MFRLNRTIVSVAGAAIFGLCAAFTHAGSFEVVKWDVVPATTTDATAATAQPVKPTFGTNYKLRVTYKNTSETTNTNVVALGVPLYTDYMSFTNPMAHFPTVPPNKEVTGLFSVKTASKDTHPWLFPVKEDFPAPICGYWFKTSWACEESPLAADYSPVPLVSDPLYIPGEYTAPAGGVGPAVLLAEWNGNNISGTIAADASKTATSFNITQNSKLRAGAYMRISRDGDLSVNEIVKVTLVSPLTESPRKATVQRAAMRASESQTNVAVDVKNGDKLTYLGMAIPDAVSSGIELGSELVTNSSGELVESPIKCVGFSKDSHLRVTINGIVHQKIGDLRLELTNDWGTQYQQWKRVTVRLMDQPGNGLAVGNTPITGLVFEDNVTPKPVALVDDGKGGVKIPPDTYTPVEPLATFSVDEVMRTRRWLLRAADVQAPNVGYISSWKIELVPTPPVEEPPIN